MFETNIQRNVSDVAKGFPGWNKEAPEESLDLIYKWAVGITEDQIQWYDRKKKPRRLWSQYLRALSIIFASIGALCPLIDTTGILKDRISLAQWGYVFLAVAAAVAGFDYYFGHSAGWMRFIVTQISIERALKEFQYDWVILKVQQENNPSNISIFLQRAKDFTLQIENIIKQETDAWVAEFQTNISQLEKVLKTEIAVRKPGSIRVAVKNCSDFEKVEIRMDNGLVKKLEGVSEGIINTVSPGIYEVTVSGWKDSKETKASKVVEVQAGAMALAEFTLTV